MISKKIIPEDTITSFQGELFNIEEIKASSDETNYNEMNIKIITKVPPIDDSFWDELSDIYKDDVLSNVFHSHVEHLIEQFPDEFKKNHIKKIIKSEVRIFKNYYLNAIYTVFTEKKIFDKFLQKLPEDLVKLYNYLIWKNELVSVTDISKKFSYDLLESSTKSHSRSKVLKRHFSLFQIINVWSSFKDNYYISINSSIKEKIRESFNPPKFYHLLPVKEPEKDSLIYYYNQGTILEELPAFISFINQKQMKFSKSGKPLKNTLREMQKLQIGSEFYASQKKLEFLRLELQLALLISLVLPAPTVEPLEELKNLFNKYLNTGMFSNMESLLFHIKGAQKLYNHYEENNVCPQIWNLLLMTLPVGEWVSFENIKEFSILRNLPLEVIPQRISNLFLHYLEDSDSGWTGAEKIPINEYNYPSTMIYPLIAGSYFLFAAFGLVDLAYTEPTNNEIQQHNKEYLSVFDGLKYVKLTKLGAHLTGNNKDYQAPVKIKNKVCFTLDTRRLIFIMEGDDPLKQIIIERFASEISPRRYKMSYKVFLKDCNSKKEVQDKINLFKTHISKNPPALWEEFFNKAMVRINPLTKVNKLSVYQVENDPDLMALIVGDPILKKFVLKVENQQIAISKDNYSMVKKRMEILGYLLT